MCIVSLGFLSMYTSNDFLGSSGLYKNLFLGLHFYLFYIFLLTLFYLILSYLSYILYFIYCIKKHYFNHSPLILTLPLMISQKGLSSIEKQSIVAFIS